MKKIVISVAVAVAVVFGVFQANNNNNLSELQMENVELLALGEGASASDCKSAKNVDCILLDPNDASKDKTVPNAEWK